MSTQELTIRSKGEVSGECCPQFHSEKWDDLSFKWNKKKFIKESMPTLFHVPFPQMIGKKISKMMRQATDAKALDKNMEDSLLLFIDPTAFKSEMYLSVTDHVPGAKETTLTGNFMCKVFEGSYNKVPRFMKEMDLFLNKRNKKAGNYYVHYAYCPQCAEEAGTNYAVLFAKVEE